MQCVYHKTKQNCTPVQFQFQMESHGERLALLKRISLPTSHSENEIPGALNEILSRQRRDMDIPRSMDYAFDDENNASSALLHPFVPEDRPLVTRACRDGRDGRDGMDGRDGRPGAPGEKVLYYYSLSVAPRTGVAGDRAPGDSATPYPNGELCRSFV